MNKTYEPQEFEEEIYKNWLDKKYFKASVDGRPKFSTFMPPPNVTGRAHMGHALNNTITDIMVRYKRMKGFNTLWIPGTDHAAIATEAKVVEAIKAEGLSKEKIGREKFIERGWAWYKLYGDTIISQLQRIGISPDWDRCAFTMDENLSNAVRKVFVEYYNNGLIYRGTRAVNWCPNCKTSISDIENIHIEQYTKLWHIRYPLVDGSGEVVIATTRPETLFGDTAVAVNPKDKRYKDMIGKEVILPLTNRKIKIVADEYSDMTFGTGAVKITPAHDANDYELGLRHGLEVITCIEDDGKLNSYAGEFAGMDRIAAREKIEEKLIAGGFLVKTEKYKNQVGTCERCKHITEPKISMQWFVKMKELAKPAIEACTSGRFKCTPARFNKQYINWLSNIQDWCISRQLWLGHRIPVFTCKDCGHEFTSMEDSTKCIKCGGCHVEQDSDVLDTWFSSALWPFSTLGFSGDKQKDANNKDLQYYYPFDFMTTAPEILYFWVARMMFSGLKFMGQQPYPLCILHGTVLDAKGKKMSKNDGNGIDPLEISAKYGADALRISLINGTAYGKNIKYSEDKAKDSKIFINKLWNASKFVISNLENIEQKTDNSYGLNTKNLDLKDKWLLTEYQNLVKEVNKRLDKYEEALVLGKIMDFILNVFCDWYIELAKVDLYAVNSDGLKRKQTTQSILLYVLDGILKLMHPFTPFVTEEIFQALPVHSETIMLEKYPEFDAKLAFKDAKAFEKVMSAIKAIRNTRAELKVPDNKRSKLLIKVVSSKEQAMSADIIKNNLDYIVKLGFGTQAEIITSEPTEKTAKIILEEAEIYLPLGELVDEGKEKERLEAEIKTLEFEIERSEKMLSNPGFANKAPAAMIEAEKEKLFKNSEKLRMLKAKV